MSAVTNRGLAAAAGSFPPPGRGEAPQIPDDEVLLTKEKIDLLLDRAEKSRELLGGLILSLAKWIIASLLTINAGGIVAMLNIKNLPHYAVLSAGSAFVFGLILALLCAFICLYEILRFLPDQGELMLLKPGIHKRATIDRLTSGAEAKDGIRDPILWTGWLSAASFVGGVAIAGFALP